MLIIPGWEHQIINYYKNLCMNNTQKNVLSRFKGTEITRNAALVKPKVGNGTRVNMTYFALGCIFSEGKKLPSAHVLGDFNFKDIDWPDRLSKSGSTLSQSEGQILNDIMNDHGLEQMVLEKRTHWTWFSPLYLVSFKMSTPLTNLVIVTSSQKP